eukprot:TRINITY_DN1577_c0_g1_i1.p1 TRINITY_DN1577_c0_g1~~TRINITY_DN1577_c0_g1_i1.p1  ORF type:complete len:1278 (+),score=394.18 TRINITY_DN1577_c0_g1_i1:42-3836(+)
MDETPHMMAHNRPQELDTTEVDGVFSTIMTPRLFKSVLEHPPFTPINNDKHIVTFIQDIYNEKEADPGIDFEDNSDGSHETDVPFASTHHLRKFKPSGTPHISLAETKIIDPTPPDFFSRCIETEGIYNEKYLPYKVEELKKLNDRFFGYEDYWFDKSSQLFRLQNILDTSNTDINFYSSEESKHRQLKRERVIAKQFFNDFKGLELNVGINTLNFSVFPFSNKELSLNKQLKSAYAKLQSLEATTNMNSLRCMFLKHYNEIFDSITLNGSLLELKYQHKKLLQLKMFLESADKQEDELLYLRKQIGNIWKQLESVRSETNLKLCSTKLNRIALSIPEELKNFDGDVEIEMRMKLEKVCFEVYKTINSLENGGENQQQHVDTPIWTDIQKSLTKVINWRKKLDRKNTLLLQKDDETLTVDLPSDELQRRQQLANRQYYAVLYFNNKQAAATAAAEVKFDCSIDFNEQFTFSFVSIPENATIKLFKSGIVSSIFEGEIANIPLALPGFNGTQSITAEPIFQTIQFASDKGFSSDPANPDDLQRVEGSIDIELFWNPAKAPVPKSLKPLDALNFGKNIVYDSRDIRNPYFSNNNKYAEDIPDISALGVGTELKSSELLLKGPKNTVQQEFKLKIPDEQNTKRKKALSKFLKRLKASQFAQIVSNNEKVHVEDIVIEPKDADSNFSFQKLLNLLSWTTRPLLPVRKPKSRSGNADYKLIIQISRCRHVPSRIPLVDGGVGDIAKPVLANGTLDSAAVCPFIVCSFGDQKVATTPLRGTDVSWSASFEIPLNYPTITPSTLLTIEDSITFELFDHIYLRNPKDDRYTNFINVRSEKRFLASLSIDFATFYNHNARIETTLPMNLSHYTIGYQPYVDDDEIFDPLLTFVISTSPTLPLLIGGSNSQFTAETQALTKQALKLTHEYRSSFPQRSIQLLVPNSKSANLLPCRFLLAQQPPKEIDTIELAAQFVSLVPSLNDALVFEGITDVWETCDEFFGMNAGDTEEHAIAFANFCMYLSNEPVYIGMGNWWPDGNICFVLRVLKNGKCEFWNPSSGQRISNINNIGMIFDRTNIWLNIQKYHNSSDMSFNFKDEKSWRPFVTSNNPTPFKSVQKKFVFDIVDHLEAAAIESNLATLIGKQFGEWRGFLPTLLNFSMAEKLRNILIRIEEEKAGISTFSQNDHYSMLEEFSSGNSIFGTVVSSNYKDDDHILNLVKKTCVHENGSTSVSFAVAVYVKPYPNRLFSVNVYLAAIANVHDVKTPKYGEIPHI